MPWALAIGAGVGVLKSELIDAPKAERSRKLNATIAAYSPWTHMSPGQTTEADPFGSALQFGTTAAMAKSAYNSDKSATALQDAQTKRLEGGGSLLGYGPTQNAMEGAGVDGKLGSELGAYGKSKDNPLFPGLKLKSSWWNTGS